MSPGTSLPRLVFAMSVLAACLIPASTATASDEVTITQVAAFDVTPTSASITWTVSEPATGQVEYGPTSSYGERSKLEGSFEYTTHIQTIAGLEPNTTYHFAVLSTTEAGVDVTSGGHTFTTLAMPTFAPEQPTHHLVGVGPRAPPSAPANSVTVPDSVDPSGSSDVSVQLQAWVDAQANGSVLVFPSGATYRMERGIHLNEDDRDLVFHGYGATLEMTGCGETQSESGFRLDGAKRIRILGFAIVGGNQDGGTTAAYDAGCGEWSMGVALFGATQTIEVADTTIVNVFGDAIYTNCSEAYPEAGDYDFHHNRLESTGRQLVTINQGTGIRVRANMMRAPALYAVDSEDCDSPDAVLRDVEVTGNWIDTWNWHYSPDGRGPGQDYYPCRAIANTYAEGELGEARGYLVADNLFTGGCGGWGSQVAGLCDDAGATVSMPGTLPKSEITVIDNVIDLPEAQRCGVAVDLAAVSGGVVAGNSFPGQEVRCRDCESVEVGENLR